MASSGGEGGTFFKQKLGRGYNFPPWDVINDRSLRKLYKIREKHFSDQRANTKLHRYKFWRGCLRPIYTIRLRRIRP